MTTTYLILPATARRTSRGSEMHQDKTLTPVKRIRYDLLEPIWLTDTDGVTSKVFGSKSVVRTLGGLLSLANGRRLIATTGSDLSLLMQIPSRTVVLALKTLADVGYITKLETTVLRRIRIEARMDDDVAILLPETTREALRVLYELGEGQKTFTLRAIDFAKRMNMDLEPATKHLLTLIKRGAVTELTKSTYQLDLYRIDVKRSQGRGMQLTQLPPEMEDDPRHPLLLLIPSKIAIVDNVQSGEDGH